MSVHSNIAPVAAQSVADEAKTKKGVIPLIRRGGGNLVLRNLINYDISSCTGVAKHEQVDTERSRSVLLNSIEVFAAGEATTSHVANKHRFAGSATASRQIRENDNLIIIITGSTPTAAADSAFLMITYYIKNAETFCYEICKKICSLKKQEKKIY